ncbi:uncharacterized mitochondrial protein AtMg00810-like, partial [Macadamia integrifolia]|uniref:uncharacterized mitochondrial protein AtMg00810-like n=1 Tax=Macadamia integrifolia TaxID=60698 RepID=UPI001C4F890E
MISFGHRQSQADNTLFAKTKGNQVTALIFYIDDIVITGNNDEEVFNLKALLAAEFKTKDLGPLRYFLGIEVARSNNDIFISLRKYVLDLLSETCMLGCKPTYAPMEVNYQLRSAIGDSVDKEQYQRLVGRLIYLSHTRPDIACVVGIVSCFLHDPRTPHLDVVYQILRYLKFAPGK